MRAGVGAAPNSRRARPLLARGASRTRLGGGVSSTSSARRIRWAAWQLALLVASGGAAPPQARTAVRLALGTVSSTSSACWRVRLALGGAVGSALDGA